MEELMDKPRPKPNQGSSWTDEQDKMTNPNRRQDEDQDTNIESPRSDQRASSTEPGSTESATSDERESQGDRQRDRSRRQGSIDRDGSIE